MTEALYQEQIRLEEESRGLTIQRYRDAMEASAANQTFSDTDAGCYLIRNYLIPFSSAIAEFQKADLSKPGRAILGAKLLRDLDPDLVAFLALKGIINRMGLMTSAAGSVQLTGLAIYVAGMIHSELRMREFEKKNKRLSRYLKKDFDRRELPREKREGLMRGVFNKHKLDWEAWSRSDHLHVGTALIDLFIQTTGDMDVKTYTQSGKSVTVVVPTPSFVQALERRASGMEAMLTVYYPTVIPPRPWSSETLEWGGYYSHNVSPYFLVKSSRKAYRKLLKEKVADGSIDDVLRSVNGLQETPWAINKPVLEALRHVYSINMEVGKLPRSDSILPDPPPTSLDGLPHDHPDVQAYRAYRYQIHEANRRVVGKRVMASRAISLAQKFSQYERFYYPHDMDSRGRVYPKPAILNPQGPDYVKGLLHFADGKALGATGLRWLAVHGANCWGADKLPLHERAEWGNAHLDLARSVARDPRADLQWTKADNPFQFLAWCLEWSAAHELDDPSSFVSHLHVDLDATCSGLQHFSAMLRDKVGGFNVNMVPCDARQDVYGAVAEEAIRLTKEDVGTDKDGLAQALLDFGIDRSLTKRSVMVKPYAGTRQSCMNYVSEAIDEQIAAGKPLPWAKSDLFSFKLYAADKVWSAIPKVVVAADGAMRWLSAVSRAVGKSSHAHKRVEWVTPLGLPVWQYKFNLTYRRIATHFSGSIIKPRLLEETDVMDSRKMATSVPPSFVHSLDAAHLQATFAEAHKRGLRYFASVHDSFGVHACDVEDFSKIIRSSFVKMYGEHDVLEEFFQSNIDMISDDLREDIPAIPEKGTLNLQGILENEFFFS